MRITGFLALAAVLVVAVIVIVISNLRSVIPEPHASCIEAWRDVPDSPLRQFGLSDLRVDEEESVVENDGRRIATHVGPVARSAGRPVTVNCVREDDGSIRPLGPGD